MAPEVGLSTPFSAEDATFASTAELERALGVELAVALRRVAEAVRRRFPCVTVEVAVGRGPPAEAIVRAAAEHDAERIVIGTHGRRGVSHLLLGSVAERVLRLAEVPVLVVKAHEREP